MEKPKEENLILSQEKNEEKSLIESSTKEWEEIKELYGIKKREKND